jgi:hypothetical protein
MSENTTKVQAPERRQVVGTGTLLFPGGLRISPVPVFEGPNGLDVEFQVCEVKFNPKRS